jgi:hypothetical protein
MVLDKNWINIFLGIGPGGEDAAVSTGTASAVVHDSGVKGNITDYRSQAIPGG